MICQICGELAEQPICVHCCAELIEEKRTIILNKHMSDIDKEADNIFELDPTGRNKRGPKWVTG